MPLVHKSADEAFASIKRNKASVWPDGRRSAARLEGVATIEVSPTFSFDRSAPILTFGSCFARNIEWHLVSLGFDLPMTGVTLPEEERASGVTNDILNKYSIHAIENEIRWAFEGCDVPPEALFLETKDGLWHDPQFSPNLVPASLERLQERRELVLAAVREMARSSVVIITLGLAESWYDSLTGLYLNGAPPLASLKRYPDRFFLDILTYSEILESLERTYALIRKYGRADIKVLITTSPVPFKATFSGDDALVANCYSKSVQRAACQEFSTTHDGVDYFPSYEVVTLTERTRAYEVDNIHVRPAVVARIMNKVVSVYCPDVVLEAEPEPEETVAFTPVKGRPLKLDRQAARVMFKHGAYEHCALQNAFTLETHAGRISDDLRHEILSETGNAYLMARKNPEAVKAFKEALGERPFEAATHYGLGIAYSRSRKPEKAIAAFQHAVTLDPATAEYRWRLGWEVQRAGDHTRAKALFLQALDIDPAYENASKALQELDQAA